MENVYRNFSSIISLTAIEPDKEETVKIEKKEIDQKNGTTSKFLM